MSVQKVGVIGAGTIGSGVAQDFAQAGYKVILVDTSSDVLDLSKQKIGQNIRIQKLFNRSQRLESSELIMENINFVVDYELLGCCDFIVENVPEIWDTKRQVYTKIDNICLPHCIFAVNTSCISITKIAAITSRRDRVIGVHFMNPVPLKNTVEVIRGYYTSEDCVNETLSLLKQLKKEAIVVNDFPGFVSNRISHLLMNEAACVVQDGVATPLQVDEIFKKCYEHKIGPLETADLIGLDTVVNSLDVLFESYKDSKFRCCPLLRKMVEAGLLGRKSGQGFFKYS